MADIDPFSQIQQLTPRQTTIVDAIAETKRVTESIMRSNPLRNAKIDDGLMVWRGNYAGQGGLADSYLWIGEFYPRDAVMDKGQRGFLLTRDDPKHQKALWMYDPQAESRSPTNPLRQRVFMSDADGGAILTEGAKGGTAFPFAAIPMVGTAVSYYNVRVDSGTGMKFLPILPAYSIGGSGPRTYWEGYGPMVGTSIDFYGFGNSNNTGTWQTHLEIEFGDSDPTYVSSNIVCPANGSAVFAWKIDFSGQNKVGKRVHVRVISEMLNGVPEWCIMFPAYCNSVGDN